MEKLLLLDVSSYIFRAYHALPPLTNPKGEQINSIFGFINMYLKASKKFKDFYVAAALDSGREKSARREKYEQYKANRKEIDPELRAQFPYIKPMLEALNIPHFTVDGYEADDIIAAFKKKYPDHEIYIFSSDKDLMQLIDDHSFLYDSMKGKVFDSSAVLEKFEVNPSQVRDLLAIMGDSSDNIPGLPGVGPKTASKLLNTYGVIENIYEHLDELPEKLSQKFVEFKSQLEISRELATLVDSVNIDGMPLQKWTGINPDIFIKFASDMGFKSLIRQLGLESAPLLFETPPTQEQKQEIYEEGSFELMPNESYLFLWDKGSLFVAAHGKFMSTAIESLPDAKYYGFDIKELLGYPFPKGEFTDLQLAYFITDSGRHSYSLEDVAGFLGVDSIPSSDDPASKFKLISAIKTKLDKMFSVPRFEKLLREIEMPNLEIVRGMEQIGIKIDFDKLSTLRDEFNIKLKKLEEDIYAYAGCEFNISSPKQLGEILFKRLGLPAASKKESTDKTVLQALGQFHPLPALVLEYREFAKLLSTYIEPINAKTGSDGRLHTTYIVTHAATGRLASRDPNLQNIPVRTEEGRKIREIFIAPEGYTFISLDYSQIELRILAVLSDDAELKTAFRNNDDIHKKTAAAIFSTFPEMVDETMRRHAKAVNFGIVYGMQAFKLSQDTGVQVSFAKEYIENYFRFYRGVKAYIDNVLKKAVESGFVETLFGRRRYIPEITSTNKNIAKSGERMAVSSAVQGSAADIIKLGAINIHETIRQQNLDAKIILQIHDELIIEVPENAAQEMANLFAEKMKNAIPDFPVPLEVNSSIGRKWSDLK